MIPLPRASLPDMVAARLREGITAGRWSGEMPSEAELCRELQVSRVTVRKAIAQLVRERWLTFGGSGCRHRVRRKATERTLSEGRIVRVLMPYTMPAMGVTNHVLLENLAEGLGAAGFRLSFEHRPALYHTHSPKDLKRLDSLPDTAAWVLFYGTEPMQRWFGACGRPCLVMGFTYPEVELPSVRYDAPAAARHAVGLFFQRGHRELIYFTCTVTSRSDTLASEAFIEEARRLGARARIFPYGTKIPALRRTIGSALALRPRPTAFFSSSPESCLTILGTLLQAGLRVPEDAALIAGWADYFLECSVPTIACYKADGADMGRRAAKVVLDLLKHGPGKLRRVRILPEFIPGGTLGAARASGPQFSG